MDPTPGQITRTLGLIILIGAAGTVFLGWYATLALGTAACLAALTAKSISNRHKASARDNCTRAEKHWKAHWHRSLSHRKWKKRDV